MCVSPSCKLTPLLPSSALRHHSADRNREMGPQKRALPLPAQAAARRRCSWHSILFGQVPLDFFPLCTRQWMQLCRAVCVSAHSWPTTSACAKELSVSLANSEADFRVPPALFRLTVCGGFNRASVVSSLQQDRDWTDDLKLCKISLLGGWPVQNW